MKLNSAASMGAIFFFLSLALQAVWIRAQRHMSLMQAQKSYGVGIDVEIKASTPSMGGLVFLVLALLALVLTPALNLPGSSDKAGSFFEAFLFWSFPLAGGLIGLIDDGLKFFTHSSEGFKSLSKLRAQLVVCAVWVIALQMDGRPGLWPGLCDTPPSWAWAFLILPLAFLSSAGMLNAVNITDGLDGLAGGCFLISLGTAPLLLPMTGFNITAIAVLFFTVAGFMFYNNRPARTFMGDTGAHFLGGALAALCLINGRLLALLPMGFLFIIEMLTSAIQIFTIRRWNRRVFLMAPLHHHFQRMGWDETKVTTRFWLVHAAGAAWLSLALNALL